jgi:hypothetical protein
VREVLAGFREEGHFLAGIILEKVCKYNEATAPKGDCIAIDGTQQLP